MAGRRLARGPLVDSFGTALLWSRQAGALVPAGYAEALFGWLVTHVDPATGVWGSPARETGMLLPVNGFYRASRGTFAQFGVPVTHPERVARWQDGAGVAFGPGDEAGLQGTEMWLAITWYLADLLGLADALGYRPRGVHRPEPADALA